MSDSPLRPVSLILLGVLALLATPLQAQLGETDPVELERGIVKPGAEVELTDFSLALRIPAGAKPQVWLEQNGLRLALGEPGVLRFALGKAALLAGFDAGTKHTVVVSVKRDARQALTGLWVDGVEVASTNVPPGKIVLTAPVEADVLRLYSRPLSRPEAIQWNLADQPAKGLAIIGGGEAVALIESGYLEALWTAQQPVRSLAWEGDTVFRQDRPLSFGTLPDQLRRLSPQVVMLMFGRQECLESGAEGLAEFSTALEKLVRSAGLKGWIIGPPPFEKKPAPMRDLSELNSILEQYGQAIETVAKANGMGFVNLQRTWPTDSVGWTRDGVQLTDNGLRTMAKLMAAELGGVTPPAEINTTLLRLVREKNQLWHDYWRPANWAFLYGDRTAQPSSRDHMDATVRWFPKELEKYRELIAAKETEMMNELSNSGRKLP